MALLAYQTAGGWDYLLPSDSGHLNVGFTELREATFKKPEGESELYVDDIPIATVTRDGLAVWAWTPGFYAGTVRAELIRPNEKRGTTFLLDVSPDPAKVGQALFSRMVNEVWAYDPALIIGEQASQTAIGTTGNRDDPAIRYMRLANHAAEFVAAMQAVRRDPHKALHAARVHVPLHRVRRADLQTARNAIASNAARALLAEDESDTFIENRGPQPLFDIPNSETTLDSAANRTIATLAQMVIQAVDLLSSDLQRQFAGAQDEHQRELEKRWPRRGQVLADLRSETRRFLLQEPLASVTRREVTSAGLTAIAANPIYSRVQTLIWRMLRIGYEHGERLELSAMSPTWAVYEAWCYTSIVGWLRARFPGWLWTRTTAGDRHCLRGIHDKQELELSYQRPFSYYPSPPHSGYWSVSAQFIPDIVLLARSGDQASWLVLDAKYRRGRQNVLDGMRSAHVYRDALRFRGKAADWSLLLIPARAQDAEWLHDSSYIETHRVGAIPCNPESLDWSVLERLVASLSEVT